VFVIIIADGKFRKTDVVGPYPGDGVQAYADCEALNRSGEEAHVIEVTSLRTYVEFVRCEPLTEGWS
jgi:hypothetical protein